jgi:hypothetical protein
VKHSIKLVNAITLITRSNHHLQHERDEWFFRDLTEQVVPYDIIANGSSFSSSPSGRTNAHWRITTDIESWYPPVFRGFKAGPEGALLLQKPFYCNFIFTPCTLTCPDFTLNGLCTEVEEVLLAKVSL